MVDTLITGTSGGLGKRLFSLNEGALSLTRQNRHNFFTESEKVELSTVIHCAFNSAKNPKNYYNYLDDNFFLTQELCTLKHKKFIYISSIDVYREEDSLYKFSKLAAEDIVKNKSQNYLILRCGAIVGPTMRYNTLLKLMREKKPHLSLNKHSQFNYILQDDINNFITKAINNNICGTYDFVSTTNMSLLDVADYFKCSPTYGSYTYTTPKFDILPLAPYINKTSEQVIKEFEETYES